MRIKKPAKPQRNPSFLLVLRERIELSTSPLRETLDSKFLIFGNMLDTREAGRVSNAWQNESEYHPLHIGGVPRISRGVPSTRSAAQAMDTSRSSSPPLPMSCRPTGIPRRSRPTGNVAAHRVK